jgi:hypothetical protein
MPDVLVVTFQSGDYAGRIEIWHNNKLVLEVWGYVSVINI